MLIYSCMMIFVLIMAVFVLRQISESMSLMGDVARDTLRKLEQINEVNNEKR